jgi:flavodoxin I
MKTLVIYDSLHGNTKKIAQAVGDALAGEIKVLHVTETNVAELKSHDLVFVGAPTHGGRPSPPMKELLDKIQANGLDGVKVAAFDTRLPKRWVGIFGFAAGRIAKSLERHGGTLMGSPEGFFVEGTEGPLREGELQRAAAWAQDIVASMS